MQLLFFTERFAFIFDMNRLDSNKFETLLITVTLQNLNFYNYGGNFQLYSPSRKSLYFFEDKCAEFKIWCPNYELFLP